MKLICGITTKNEEWIIGKTLSVISKFCDKIVVLDDNSTDRTEDICRSFEKVEWNVREKRNQYDRKEAEGLNHLFQLVTYHNPDYILILDADEIPTPSFQEFFKNIDPKISAWKIRMINLYGDDKHYRVDSFNTPSGININWNPFNANSWRKTVLLKYDKNYSYKYNLNVQKGGTSIYHPAPKNIKGKIVETDEFYIIHYGKINQSYINGDKDRLYANIESRDGKGSYEKCLARHVECRISGTPILKQCPKQWFWN
tara:strand:- start:545 stop:1312 length:768 start_codon:yes stop_codon:yes gene_type:complete